MSVGDRLEGVRGRLRAARDRVSAFVAPAWRWMRDEPMAGIAISVALHVAIIALIVHFGGPGSTYTVKRGEPLFVELPEVKEQAQRGNPGPPAPPTPPAAAKAAPKPAAPRAQPPAAKSQARPTPPEPPRVATARAPERPAAPEKPAPPVEKPAPKAPEPPPADTKNALPAPVQQARPAPTPAAPAPAPPAAAPAAPPSGPSGPPAEPSRSGPPGSQVAAIPPGPKVFDLKSLGRGGGAGGRGEGRGGIEGEPIPLDSPDPKYSDYLDRIRRMIKERWGYPCIKTGSGCDYKTAELVIEFGIAKDGHVPFISLVNTSGFPIYDDYALNAIRLASPFPPVPDSLSKKGFPILARFRYVVDTSLVNTLR